MKKEELLKKFLDNQCSQEELEYLLDLLKADKDDPIYSKVLEKAWRASDPTSLQGEELSSFIQGVQTKAEHLTPKPHTSGRSFARPMMRYAAAVIILCLPAFAVFWWVNTPDKAAHIAYQTTNAEIRQVTLPDQTLVTLNANSALRYDEQFQDAEIREVWLEGEAFFTVMHLPTHKKFVVHTNDLDVEVLGTTFNVNNRRERTRVVLNSGKVRLRLEENPKSMVMQPGDFVEFSRKEQKIMHKQVEPEKYNAWTEHTLVFESKPLPEVLETLEDIYGYTVVVTEEVDLSAYSLTSKVSSRNPEILLQIIEKTFELNVEKKDALVRIKK